MSEAGDALMIDPGAPPLGYVKTFDAKVGNTRLERFDRQSDRQ